jgi:hypothetical protein
VSDKRIILAFSPTGNARAVGPFKNDRTLTAARDMIKKAPGWDYHDTVTLISGGDLPFLIGRSAMEDSQ